VKAEDLTLVYNGVKFYSQFVTPKQLSLHGRVDFGEYNAPLSPTTLYHVVHARSMVPAFAWSCI
jgi:hypothetical protein